MEKLIDVTDNAMDFIKKSIAQENCLGMRINVISGGCHGMTYEVDFVKEADPSDLVIQKDDINIYIASNAVIFISGTTINYDNNPLGGKLVFENPNATSECGCGRSFCCGMDSGCEGKCCS